MCVYESKVICLLLNDDGCRSGGNSRSGGRNIAHHCAESSELCKPALEKSHINLTISANAKRSGIGGQKLTKKGEKWREGTRNDSPPQHKGEQLKTKHMLRPCERYETTLCKQ